MYYACCVRENCLVVMNTNSYWWFRRKSEYCKLKENLTMNTGVNYCKWTNRIVHKMDRTTFRKSLLDHWRSWESNINIIMSEILQCFLGYTFIGLFGVTNLHRIGWNWSKIIQTFKNSSSTNVYANTSSISDKNFQVIQNVYSKFEFITKFLTQFFTRINRSESIISEDIWAKFRTMLKYKQTWCFLKIISLTKSIRTINKQQLTGITL